jgi:hypothetical protein
MTMLFVMLAISLAAVALFYYAAQSRGRQLSSMEDFRARWQKVDIGAFSNLVDASEDRFLRERLQPNVYRHIRRERLKAAREYLGRVGDNARLMIQAGQIIQRHNAGPEAERARQHVDTAIRLRTAVFFAQCNLGVQILFPSGEAHFEKVLQLYSDAAHSFDNTLDPGTATVTM